MQKHSQFIILIIFALLFGLALFLRVRGLDTTKIGGDQSFTLNTAMRWVNGEAMPLAANKSSAGFMNPPMIEYLYAAALRLWPDILSVAALTMISGLLAITVAGWATYKVFGLRAAFWTVLIFTVNPWSVLYSQLIWNQTMAPIFSALTFACLLLYFADAQSPGYLILSFVGAACMTQVHLGTVVQLLTIGLVCVIFWRKLQVWPLIVGIAIFALLYTPFLIYEAGVDWIDLQAALEAVRQPASFSIAALLVSADLLRAQGLLDSIRYTLQLDNLAMGLLALSLAYALWMGARALRPSRREPETTRKATGICILLLWFILPILFYLRSSQYLQIYYLIGQLPAHFLLIGVGLDGGQRWLEQIARRTHRPGVRRALKAAIWAILPLPLLLLTGWQFFFNLQFQDHRLQRNDAGPPQIRHMRSVIRLTRQFLAERPGCDMVAVSEGHRLETSKLSLLREFTVPERVRLTDGRLAIPAPASCTLYLDALPGSSASTWLAAVAEPLPEAKIEVRGQTWQFYILPDGAPANLTSPLSPETQVARWVNGIVLTEYTRGPVVSGSNIPLRLRWAVESTPEEVYHIGTYLLSADNRVIAQSDGPGFDSVQLQNGDRFITWFDISAPQDLPPGDYQLAVALYTWPKLERVYLESGENTAFLEQIRAPEQ